jgi:hypothetical protein
VQRHRSAKATASGGLERDANQVGCIGSAEFAHNPVAVALRGFE